jgi:hypothetical protein
MLILHWSPVLPLVLFEENLDSIAHQNEHNAQSRVVDRLERADEDDE